jgi:hypothetical protein
MAITIPIYSNVNALSRSITVDFVGDILAADSKANVSSTNKTYYFKFTTGARDTDGIAFDPKLSLGLSDLALGGVKQSSSDTANAYADVSSMVIDYTYDFIYGHTANQYSSGVAEQKPMQL